MRCRLLLSALALATIATGSEAGPLRRSQPSYQPAYRPVAQPSYQPVAQSSPVTPTLLMSTSGVLTNATPTGTSAVEYVSGYTPVVGTSNFPEAAIVPADGFAGDGLDEVNAKRASRGLRPFVRDEGLTHAARACAQFRATNGLFGHTSNDFSFVPAGTSASSAGCAAYPASYGWMSCCVYENYTYGGAAYVTGRDGKRYMHLFVR
ncbi:MAG: hypothetical protein K8U57_15650 [Planctomycetes bacterium]|nr:hypothetical protein [Planctomycetota bacterium]